MRPLAKLCWPKVDLLSTAGSVDHVDCSRGGSGGDTTTTMKRSVCVVKRPLIGSEAGCLPDKR